MNNKHIPLKYPIKLLCILFIICFVTTIGIYDHYRNKKKDQKALSLQTTVGKCYGRINNTKSSEGIIYEQGMGSHDLDKKFMVYEPGERDEE